MVKFGWNDFVDLVSNLSFLVELFWRTLIFIVVANIIGKTTNSVGMVIVIVLGLFWCMNSLRGWSNYFKRSVIRDSIVNER